MKKKRPKKKLKLNKLTVGPLTTSKMADVRGGLSLACVNNPCKTTHGGCNLTAGAA